MYGNLDAAREVIEHRLPEVLVFLCRETAYAHFRTSGLRIVAVIRSARAHFGRCA